ncbi:MAG TPA: aldose 1-epimerase family protein [Aquaticitalea sp.]|nr:aldose 1-epimerase family protein [Aquaticitalea sp.]
MTTLKNELLTIRIKTTGAELCEISSVKNGTQFMWNANAKVWGNHAPNLFPIVGMLKDEIYYFEGQRYSLPKHGFIRNNTNFQIVEASTEMITLSLVSDDETLKTYPFKFEYDVIYQLEDHQLHITYKVANVDSKTMYFSVGGHPAFKCPAFNDETYQDYQLVFNKEESSETYLLNLKTGLVTSETKPIFDSANAIKLRPDLFNKDALIFKDLKSRKVTLQNAHKGDILTMHFEDFPYLGVWAKPNADFVCIEPWLGIADSETSNQQLTDKEGIITLDSGKTFEASYTIEIHTPQLV